MKLPLALIKLGLILVFTTGAISELRSQTGLPDIITTTSEGKSFNLSELGPDRVTVVVFWATWCKPCIDELDNIADYYTEWTDQADFNFVTVCIDDARTSPAVRGFLKGREWPFLVLMDENQDLKRTMNVTDIPYYCIYSKEGKVVYRHTGYLPGDEEYMFEEIQAHSND